MRLRYKKTGEIVELEPLEIFSTNGNLNLGAAWYSSIKDFVADWEDVPEEPKGSALDLMILTLTNFIENEPDEDKVDLEDCKQMLGKLKAWKRLKDKGFRFGGWKNDAQTISYNFGGVAWPTKELKPDLDLLFFGGEE